MVVPTATAVLVDTREPAWVRELRFGGAPVALRALDAGDVHVLCSDGAVLGVERKTPGDLIHSTLDGRLFAQAARLRATTPHAYLLLDGLAFRGRGGQVVDAGRDTGFSWVAWQGALLTAQELGVAVLQLPEGAFEEGVLGLVKRARGPVRPARRALALDDPGVTILTALPGVGYDRALALLRTCGTVATALWALTETHPRTWTNTPEGRAALGGIGPKRKALVRGALGLADGDCLMPVHEDPPDAPSEDPTPTTTEAS